MKAKLVVVIDDDPDDVEMLKYIFKKADSRIQCLAFLCPVEAIKKLSDENSPVPDCVFIDINMPVLNGSECLEELRKVKRFQHVPMIMLSTTVSDRIDNDLKLKGATLAFQKPFKLSGYYQILMDIPIMNHRH